MEKQQALTTDNLSARQRRAWWLALLLGLGLPLALAAVTYVTARSLYGGQPYIYCMDDAYIHLGVARNWVERGVFGVNTDHFTNMSSSPIYTLICAALIKTLPTPEAGLLWVAVGFYGALVVLVWRWMRGRGKTVAQFLFYALALCFAVPAQVVMLNGMEHAIHLFFITGVLLAYLDMGEDQTSNGTKLGRLSLWLTLAAFTRFETVFLALPLAALDVWQRRWPRAAVLLACSIGPPVLFMAWCASQGGSFVPNSVGVKTVLDTSSAGRFLLTLIARIVGNILSPDRFWLMLTGFIALAMVPGWLFKTLIYFSPSPSGEGRGGAGRLPGKEDLAAGLAVTGPVPGPTPALPMGGGRNRSHPILSITGTPAALHRAWMAVGGAAIILLFTSLTGHVMRYEMWLMALLCLLVALELPALPQGRAWLRWAGVVAVPLLFSYIGHQAALHRSGLTLLYAFIGVGVVLAAAGLAMGRHGSYYRLTVICGLATLLTAFSFRWAENVRDFAGYSLEVYNQQWQMGRFIKQYADGEPIIMNDIGMAAFYTRSPILDMAGLASDEMAPYVKRHALHRQTDDMTRPLDSLARAKGVRLAIIYPDWMPAPGRKAPARWELVGLLKTKRCRILGRPTVGFYALDDAQAQTLYQNLQDFAKTIPPGDELTIGRHLPQPERCGCEETVHL